MRILFFYGQPEARGGAVTHAVGAGSAAADVRELIRVRLSDLPDDAARLAFTITIHNNADTGYTIKDLRDLQVRVVDVERGEELLRFAFGADLSLETAMVVGELYRHGAEWKFSAVGSGFFGGLAALCTSFGLEVAGEEGQVAGPDAGAASVEAVQTGELAKVASAAGAAAHAAASASSAAHPAPALSSIDLRKKKVELVLTKKQMTHVSARVGLVLDISGSMLQLYRNGTVQEVVERILAVACKFDDNAELDVWVYDNEFSRLPAAREQDFEQYVTQHIINNKKIHKFGRNNEPPVMLDVIRNYTVEDVSPLPAFIVFINDGGVHKSIKKVIVESAVQPIFWQFVGIGDADFEVLKKLDTMEGRVVDNANFIHIPAIGAIGDEELYDMLLSEFPQWLKAAEAQRIVRGR